MNTLVLFLSSLIIYSIPYATGKVLPTKLVPSNSKQPTNKPSIEQDVAEFSPQKKKPHVFSYATANLPKHGINIKEFSFKTQRQLNLLKSKLDSEKGTNQKFSYADALKNYLHTQTKIPVQNIKANVVDFLSGIDVVKSNVGQPGKSVPKPQALKQNVPVAKTIQSKTTSKATADGTDHVSVAIIKEISKLIETISAKMQQQTNTKSSTLETTTTATTTEQPETEAPETEESPTTLPHRSTSRCFCMDKCSSTTTFESFCGKPDSFGNRKFKCCTSGGNMSSAEEGEGEVE